MSGKISDARKKSGLSAIYAQGEEYAVFRAYIVGPSDLDGQVTISQGRLRRFLVTRLRDRVGADRDGIVIQGLTEARESWPNELTLTYRSKTGTRQVSLQKDFSEEEMPTGYRGVLGEMQLKKRSTLDHPPTLKVVWGAPANEDLIVGIQTDADSGKRAYFVRKPAQ